MDISDLEEDIIICAAVQVVAVVNERKKKLPSIRVNPYLNERNTKGRFAKDFFDMVSNVKVFKENFHMEPETFRTLFEVTEPFLFPLRNTRPHDNITALEKFAVVIEFLASGAIQRHVAGVYRISKQHFGKILDDVCTAICKALSGEIAALDETEMVRIANEFNAQWNLPNCVGAIDGKHVAIKCPPNAGSMFYNYKGFHSIVLMAIADANYKFVYIDVGGYGSEGDANVFGATRLGKDIIQNKLPFPPDMPVGPEKLPFYFVADDAFALKKRIVKPFVPRKPNKLSDEERIANYRISRARRCVENCFGILVSKWICLSRTMFCGPDKSQKVVSACCYLHNYLLRTTKSYCPQKFADYYDESGNLIEGEWRKQISKDDELSSFQSAVGRPNECGKILRNKLKDFVNSPIGSLPWQKKAAYLE